MKFLSSSSTSSSSSSTTTTTSFDGNICSSKSGTTGCIAGVFRLLLCSSSLPTYPSDHITETNSVEFDKHQELKPMEKIETSVAPGIVARLMGLNSMPETNLAHPQMIPNSITRSRSMNSVDHWPECDRIQGGHRRVKTSLSFREMPTFFEREDEEFFILSFENGGESKELRSKERKSEMGFGELKQRKTERCKNKENRGESLPEKKKNEENEETPKKVSTEKENLRRRVSEKPSQIIGSNCKIKDSSNVLRPRNDSSDRLHVASEIVKRSKPIKNKEVCNGSKSRKKKKKKNHSAVKKVVPECSSEDSSPVSVLDFHEFHVDLEVPTSEEDSRLTGSNSKRKLLPEQETCEQPSPSNTSVIGQETCEQPSPSNTSVIGDDGERKTTEGKCHGSRKKDYQSRNYSDMWDEICRLAEGEMMESNWVFREMWKLEDFEDIGAVFGVQIFDQLLNELVDQLVGSPLKKFHFLKLESS